MIWTIWHLKYRDKNRVSVSQKCVGKCLMGHHTKVTGVNKRKQKQWILKQYNTNNDDDYVKVVFMLQIQRMKQ